MPASEPKLKPIKPRKCKAPGCGKEFTPSRPLQVVCGFDCSLAWARLKGSQRQKKDAQIRRAEHREAKTKAKTKRDWMPEAQASFNAYIRMRDADLPCVSCGRFDAELEWTPGGIWDCGHFLGVGAYPELRFEPLNAHKQCKKCNGGSGRWAKKKRGVDDAYRIELIARIGIDRVEWLEGHHEAKHYTIDDLKEIKAKYSRLARELKNNNK